MTAPGPTALPLVIIETNILYDYFLGRDPDLLLLIGLVPAHVEVVVPEFALLEFRGSILRELGRMEAELSKVRGLANELDRADNLNTGVSALRGGCTAVVTDLGDLRQRVDPFVQTIRSQVRVEPHSADIHYRGDLRFVQGLPPDKPKRGVQDCRILEAVLEIGRSDAGTNRAERVLLTKDSDFQSAQLAAELGGVGITLENTAGAIYGRHSP